jgi:hypothetical protein
MQNTKNLRGNQMYILGEYFTVVCKFTDLEIR